MEHAIADGPGLDLEAGCPGLVRYGLARQPDLIPCDTTMRQRCSV